MSTHTYMYTGCKVPQTTVGLTLFGSTVDCVVPGGPAHLGGLDKGDVILMVCVCVCMCVCACVCVCACIYMDCVVCLAALLIWVVWTRAM